MPCPYGRVAAPQLILVACANPATLQGSQREPRIAAPTARSVVRGLPPRQQPVHRLDQRPRGLDALRRDLGEPAGDVDLVGDLLALIQGNCLPPFLEARKVSGKAADRSDPGSVDRWRFDAAPG